MKDNTRHPKDTGFVKLWRSITESSLWTMPAIDVKLFFYLVAHANWKNKKWWSSKLQRDIVIPRGSLVTSINHLAEGVREQRSRVYRSLCRLGGAHKITRKSEHEFTVVTICNYDYYNDAPPPTRNMNRNTNRTRLKKGKNIGTRIKPKNEKFIAALTADDIKQHNKL